MEYLPYLFLFTTILFGFFLMMLIRGYSITGLVQISISWLLGSMSTSLIVWVETLFIPFDVKTVYRTIVYQILFVFFTFDSYFDMRPHFLNFKFENHRHFYTVIISVSIISLIYLNSIYSNSPFFVPYTMSQIVDQESSFLCSFLSGSNNFPRFKDALTIHKYHNYFKNISHLVTTEDLKNEIDEDLFNYLNHSHTTNFTNIHNPFFYFIKPLFFNDPMRNFKTFSLPSFPLIYLSLLNASGLSYSEASVILCFLNIVATSIAVLFFSHFFFKIFDVSIVVIFLFCSGWSFYHFCQNPYLLTEPLDFDLIHSFGSTRKSPFFSPIWNLLSYSKHTSFAIPMALMSLALAHVPNARKKTTYTLAGFLVALNPSPAVSVALSISLLFYTNSIKYIWPFLLLNIPKLITFNENYLLSNANTLFSFNIKYNPIWREYQLNGVFYSFIVVWFDSFGPLFFVFLFSPLILYISHSKLLTRRFLASFYSFVFLNFFRVGNDYVENITAIISVFLPLVVFFHGKLFEKLFEITTININIFKYYNINHEIPTQNANMNQAMVFFADGNNQKSLKVQGVLLFLKYLIPLFFVIGSFCSAYVSTSFNLHNFIPTVFYQKLFGKSNLIEVCWRCVPGYSYVDIGLLKFLNEFGLGKRTPVFVANWKFCPISGLLGRPIFAGDLHSLWDRGADVSEEMKLIQTIKMKNNSYEVMMDLGYKYLLELIEKPFVITNSTIINKFDVLYTDEKYGFLKLRE